MNRKAVSLLCLLLILPLTSSPALAAGASSENGIGIAASLGAFLGSLLELCRSTTDPKMEASATNEGRWTIDPNGEPNLATETDGRWTIDPNG